MTTNKEEKKQLSFFEFSVLRYLEENIGHFYDQKKIIDELKISGTEIKKNVENFIIQDLINLDQNIINITEKGLKRLEPYKVKKAIILAAGFGSRMMPATKNRPKPLVKVNGTRFIDTLLDALIVRDIRDITIVRGYQKDCWGEIFKKYPFVKLVTNNDYDKYSNVLSAVLVADELDGGCYICESDLFITNPNIIKKYQYYSNFLSAYSIETDDWRFIVEDGRVVDYGKGGKNCWGYYGISYFTPEDCKKLKRDILDYWNEFAREDSDSFWEFVPLTYKKEDYDIKIRPCLKSDIIEIDNYHELQMLDSSYE